MIEHNYEQERLNQVEGPLYQNGAWTAHFTLNERKSEELRGATKEEVQEQMLHFLGQQALEIEKARILLRKSFESTCEK